MANRYEDRDWDNNYGRGEAYGMREDDRDRYRRERGARPYGGRSTEYSSPERSGGGYRPEEAGDYARRYDRARSYGSQGDYGSSESRDFDNERNRFSQNRSENRYSDRYPDVASYRSGTRYSSRYQSGDDRDWRSGDESDSRSGEERGWWDRASDEVSSWFGDEEAARRRNVDHKREGEHRGRGPRGYKRSDERIKEDVNDRLTDHPGLDASEVDVAVENGEVTLSGTVSSRYEKRMAEDTAEAVSGVTNVENRLRVKGNNQQGTSYELSRTNSSTGIGLGAGAASSSDIGGSSSGD